MSQNFEQYNRIDNYRKILMSKIFTRILSHLNTQARKFVRNTSRYLNQV